MTLPVGAGPATGWPTPATQVCRPVREEEIFDTERLPTPAFRQAYAARFGSMNDETRAPCASVPLEYFTIPLIARFAEYRSAATGSAGICANTSRSVSISSRFCGSPSDPASAPAMRQPLLLHHPPSKAPLVRDRCPKPRVFGMSVSTSEVSLLVVALCERDDPASTHSPAPTPAKRSRGDGEPASCLLRQVIRLRAGRIPGNAPRCFRAAARLAPADCRTTYGTTTARVRRWRCRERG
jgi:hypothetical protein